jgi:hypothetical protein
VYSAVDVAGLPLVPLGRTRLVVGAGLAVPIQPIAPGTPLLGKDDIASHVLFPFLAAGLSGIITLGVIVFLDVFLTRLLSLGVGLRVIVFLGVFLT